MTAHPQTSFATPAGAANPGATTVVARGVRRRKGRVRRVAHAIVPRKLRRRLGRIHERIQAEMHIATRA